jgi:hypothetical protein
MATVRCPNCGVKGELRGPAEAFEPRGHLPDERPVRRCRNCGAGVVLRDRLIRPGVKAELVDPAVWRRLEDRWWELFGIGGAP